MSTPIVSQGLSTISDIITPTTGLKFLYELFAEVDPDSWIVQFKNPQNNTNIAPPVGITHAWKDGESTYGIGGLTPGTTYKIQFTVTLSGSSSPSTDTFTIEFRTDYAPEFTLSSASTPAGLKSAIASLMGSFQTVTLDGFNLQPVTTGIPWSNNQDYSKNVTFILAYPQQNPIIIDPPTVDHVYYFVSGPNVTYAITIDNITHFMNIQNTVVTVGGIAYEIGDDILFGAKKFNFLSNDNIILQYTGIDYTVALSNASSQQIFLEIIKQIPPFALPLSLTSYNMSDLLITKLTGVNFTNVNVTIYTGNISSAVLPANIADGHLLYFAEGTKGPATYMVSYNGVETSISVTSEGLVVDGATYALGSEVTISGAAFRFVAVGSVILQYLSGSGNGSGNGVPCFLADAPILTPRGYRPIASLKAGDKVRTADGRTVRILKASHYRVPASDATRPFVIPKGRFGATQALHISPKHRIMVGGSLVEAGCIAGLKQDAAITGMINYYNLELPNWEHDNMVVAGVTAESQARVERYTMTAAEFKYSLIKRYGEITPAIVEKAASVCRILADGRIEVPVVRHR